jgi:Zn-dependent peptidase ImmA (M78 family)
MRRKEVERRAELFLQEFPKLSPPIDIERIAVSSGIQVVRTVADWNESGFLLRDQDRALIGINSRNSARRQRFTIAHELGHWYLHKSKHLIVDQSVMIHKRNNISSQATSQQEIEANQFAAALLMPERFVFNTIKRRMDSGVRSSEELIDVLADEFDVSNDAMGWRLINLGILST